MDNEQKPIEELTYEEALAELEVIVASLETDEQSLENAIALYERGQQISRYCAVLLDQAELRIRNLGEDEMPASE